MSEIDAGENLEIVEETPSFESRVEALLEKMRTDDDVPRRMLAEMYIFMNDFERAQRQMMSMGGPKEILKMIMGRG